MERRTIWIIVGAVAVLLVLAGAWLFGPRVRQALTPEPTLPPEAAVGQEGLLYTTDFSTPDAVWETFDDGRIAARFEDERLVVDVDDVVDVGGWSGLGLTFEDFVLEVEAEKIGGRDDNGIFVVFRLTDENNYNRFDISSDGFYALSAVRDGVFQIVSEYRVSPAINQGDAANTIRLEAVDDTFRFAVNGEPLDFCVNDAPDIDPLWSDPSSPDSDCLGGEVVTAWVNDDLPRGKIGLGAQGFAGFDGENDIPAQAVIAFDNLTIRTPE